MARSRVHDVVIYGATGFTGERVATYFANHVSLDRTQWAIAGRSREKLLAVRERLARIRPTCARLPLIVASSDDRASLVALSKNTRVVLSTVGPFAEYGEPLFAVCAEHGTDYVDAAGEFSFVRRMHAQYGERAKERGALMVSCCGFDSVPTDLGLFYTLKQLAPKSPVRVEGLLELRGHASSGTWRSLVSALSELPHASAIVEPPAGSQGRSVKRLVERPRKDRELGWLVPLPTVDPEIALRSAAALEQYGPSVAYGHYLVVRTLGRGVRIAIGTGGLAVAAQLPFVRTLVARALAKTRGPSEAERAESWFRLSFRAECEEGRIATEVRGGDPGYDESAKMLAESALCLAVDRARLPARAGVLTPACAFGDVLLARLQRAGIAFEVLSR